MKKITTFYIVLLFCSLTFAQNISDWRGIDRDGIYHETGLLKEWPVDGPKLLWHFDDLGEGFSSAAVTFDRVYITGMIDSTGYIFAFDHQGTLLWKKNYGIECNTKFPGTRSTPIISDKHLYFLSGRGHLLCLNQTDGALKWKINVFEKFDGEQTPFGITENLLIMNDTLICTPGGKEYNVVALNKNDGSLIWKSPGAGFRSTYGSPGSFILNNKKFICFMSAGAQFCLDASNGELQWQRKHTSKYFNYANTPVYKNGLLFQSNMHAVALKIADDGKSYQEVWVDSTYDNYMSGYVIKDNYIYGSANKKDRWKCLNLNTGETLYNSKLFGHGVVVMCNEMLYCYSEMGEVALIEPSPESFKLISKFKVPYGDKQHWAHPVIANKKLYIRHGNSLMVYSLDEI